MPAMSMPAPITPLVARRTRGVTLVELLVTVSVAAILMAIAVPSMQTTMASRATSATADDLAAALRQARSEALKRGLSVSVCATSDPNASAASCIDGAWTAGWLIFADQNGDGALDNEDLLVRAFTVGKSISALSESESNAFVTFTSNGLVKGGGGREWLVSPSLDGGTQRKVCLNLAGRVQIHTGSDATC